MKTNFKQFLVGLTVALMVVLYPVVSTSKEKAPEFETVTLNSNNLLLLNSEVDGESLAALGTAAKTQDKKLGNIKEKFSGKKAPFYLFLSTPGGSIQNGLEMIETLKGIGRPVHTITSFAASMGFQIVQNLDDRLILKTGILMSHHPLGGTVGEF